MEGLTQYGSYAEYKDTLGQELNTQNEYAWKMAESFVRTGYLLRLAQDTDILSGSGYASMEEFAEKEFRLDKSRVSRYININKEYSEGGYSERLQDRYQGFGWSKLALMLSLPEAVREELTPEYSKAEIQEIKDEIDAENKITDIELEIEKAEAPKNVAELDGNLLQRAVWQLGREQQELYRRLWKAVENGERKIILDILAPQGDAVIFVRIPGTGKINITISGQATSVTNIRTQEKERHTKEDLIAAVENICPVAGADVEESFRMVYDEDMEKLPEPEKPQVAPVQPKKAEPRKQSKVIKAKTPAPAAAVQPEKEPKEQLPGQMSVGDYEGVVPEASFEELPEGREKDGEDKGAAGGMETVEESVSAGEPTEGPGAAEGRGCETDNGAACKLGTLVSVDICGCRVYPPRNAESEEDAGGDDLTKAWDETVLKAEKLAKFTGVWKWTPPENINKEQLLAAYQDAIDTAAGLEKLINMRGQAHE